MARELAIDVEVLGTVEADAALARLFNGFMKAGDSAEEAAKKVEKFEKSYRGGNARTQAKKELDALATSTSKVGGATDALTAAAMRFVGPAVAGAAIQRSLAWADAVSDLAGKHRMTVLAVQQLTGVAERNGSTFGRYAGLMEGAADRIAKGNRKTTDALAAMGLQVDELRAMDPYAVTSEIARGLAEIDDPARRAEIRMALFGESGGDALQMLDALREGIDKLVPVVDQDMVEAGDKAISMWGRFKDTVMAVTNEAILQSIAPFVSLISYVDDLTTKLDTAEERLASIRNLDPGTPSGNLPVPLAVPGNPMDGVGGNSWGFLNKSLTPGRAGRTAANVLPFRQSTFALGSTAAAMFGLANTPGGFNAGTLPFFSSLRPLASGASPISFANGSGLMGTVPMNAPNVGGGFFSKLFGGGKVSNMAAGGVGLLSQLIPGINNAGSSIGSLAGSFLGPLGSALGGLGGGLLGKLFGGNSKKNAANAEIGEVFKQFSSKEFIAIQKEADRLGISMEKALNAKTMKDFGAAVEEVTGKIEQMTALEDEIKALTEAATVDFDKMNAVVKEFGLDINKMGPAFQQAAMDKEFQKIIDALAIMEKGGADMNGVLDGMKDEISKVVQDSIKFGTTIPENMKPWIDKLIESGKLVDENGDKITDTSKMKFGAPMASEMDKVVKKLDELIAKLADLAAGFRDAGKAAGDLGNVEYPNPGTGNPDGGQSQNGSGSPGFATGGMAGRDFRRPGHGDIFPAMLRRGETVLPPGVHRGGVSLSIGNLSVGSGYGSRMDAVEEIGDAVVSYLERRGARLVA